VQPEESVHELGVEMLAASVDFWGPASPPAADQ
jgi:hypothetical protein